MYNFNPEYTLNGVKINNENKKGLSLLLSLKLDILVNFFSQL